MNLISIALNALWLVLLLGTACRADVLLVRAECTPKQGWMIDGYGGYAFTFKNTGATPAKLVKWTARWEADGHPVGDSWGGDLAEDVPPGKEVTHSEVSSLPADVAKKARPGSAVMVGAFTVSVGGGPPEDLPFRLAVPAATLRQKTTMVAGRHVGLALMASRWKGFHTQARLLRWLDQSYEAMQELTGETPDGGKRIVLKESPANPYYAYAGNPIILNTDYVGTALRDIDRGQIPFGWVHELGHDFDVLGKWYIWDGPSAEWQANWKLAYAFETIPARSFRANWSGFTSGAYPLPKGRLMLVDGTQFVNSFFLFFGDRYLADPNRKWETMSSDEIHSFYQRLQIVYGWKPFRGWYRTYRRLEGRGLKEPQTPEGKIQLACAILSEQTGADLVPVYQRWRLPVTEADVAAMRAQYLLEGNPPK